MFEVSGLLFIAPGLRPVSFYKLPKKGEADNQDLKGLGLPKRSVHTHIRLHKQRCDAGLSTTDFNIA